MNSRRVSEVRFSWWFALMQDGHNVDAALFTLEYWWRPSDEEISAGLKVWQRSVDQDTNSAKIAALKSVSAKGVTVYLGKSAPAQGTTVHKQARHSVDFTIPENHPPKLKTGQIALEYFPGNIAVVVGYRSGTTDDFPVRIIVVIANRKLVILAKAQAFNDCGGPCVMRGLKSRDRAFHIAADMGTLTVLPHEVDEHNSGLVAEGLRISPSHDAEGCNTCRDVGTIAVSQQLCPVLQQFGEVVLFGRRYLARRVSQLPFDSGTLNDSLSRLATCSYAAPNCKWKANYAQRKQTNVSDELRARLKILGINWRRIKNTPNRPYPKGSDDGREDNQRNADCINRLTFGPVSMLALHACSPAVCPRPANDKASALQARAASRAARMRVAA